MSYSKLVERYTVRFAIFFTLFLPEGMLRKIFSEKNNFRPILPPLPTPPPVVEITVGPPRMSIAEYSTATRIEYVPERFLIEIAGPIEEVSEVVKRLPSFFDELDYDLNKMVRYIEINFTPQPIDIKDAVKNIRSKVIFKGIEHLSKLVGADVNVYSFSLSFPETPLTLNWFQISVEPDVNSPSARVYVRLIKRSERFDEGVNFLDIIPKVLTIIKELLEGSHD
jgi:hypothetical protein